GGHEYEFGLTGGGEVVASSDGQNWSAISTSNLLGASSAMNSFQVVNNNNSIAVTAQGNDGQLYRTTFASDSTGAIDVSHGGFIFAAPPELGQAAAYKTLVNTDGSYELVALGPKGTLATDQFRTGTNDDSGWRTLRTNVSEFQGVQQIDGRVAVYAVD